MADNKVAILLTASDQTKSAFASVQSGLGSLKVAASGINSSLAALGVGLSAGGLAAFVKSAIDTGDELAKMSQRVGASVESLGELKYAGELADVSLEQLGTGMARLAVNLSDAKKGSGEAAAAFKQLGIDPAQFTTTDAALKAIADKFAQMPDGAQKTALAMKLLGRAGADMIPLLNGGSAAMNKSGAEARAMGLVMSEEAAKATEEFNDNLTRLQSAAKGLGAALAEKSVGPLSEISAAMVQAAKDAGLLKAAWVGLGGLGAALFTDEFADTATKIKNLQEDLKDYQGALAEIADSGFIGKFLFGKEDVDFWTKKIRETEVEITRLQAVMSKPPATAAKKENPFGIDPAEIEKLQASLAKALNTKPFDDFIKKIRESKTSVEAEWAKFKAALTPAEVIETPTILDIGDATTKARSALAGGDKPGFDAAVAQSKALLKTYAEQGGGMEVGYLSDQLRDLELEMVSISEKAAVSARDAMQRAFFDAGKQAEALKIKNVEVDVDLLAAQVKSAQDEVARQLQANPLVVPVMVKPVYQDDGALSVAALKFGSR